MVNGFVIKANTTYGDNLIDQSIKEFGYSDVDIICTISDSNNIELNTADIVKQILEITEDIDINTLKNKYVDFINQRNVSSPDLQ